MTTEPATTTGTAADIDPGAYGALDDIAGAIESLGALLRDGQEFHKLLRTTCEQAVYAVPGIDMASITRVVDGVPSTVAATDDLITALDLDQYQLGRGPCLRAAETGSLLRVSVGEATLQWPEFAEAARDAGIGSFLCAPLTVDQEFCGAINGYSRSGGGFSDLDAKLLDLYTAAAENSLYGVRRFEAAQRNVAQLEQALVSRSVIDQAKGIIMAVRQIDADAAFQALVQQSQRDNVKLREVAGQVVSTAITST